MSSNKWTDLQLFSGCYKWKFRLHENSECVIGLV